MSDRCRSLVRLLLIVFAASAIWACEGDNGQDGAPGPAGPPGADGPPGPAGPPADTASGIGDGSLLTPEDIARFGKLQATITNVEVSSPPVVEFTVLDQNDNPALGIAASAVRFTFAKLVPGTPEANGGLPYWQNYVNRTRSSDLPGGLANVIQPTVESGGELEELGDGKYRYTFINDVTSVTEPVEVLWEPTLTHRVGMEIRLDSDSGARRPMAPDNPVYDFVPEEGAAGSGVTKNIVDTGNCEGCHYEFAEHGGPKKTVEYCVTCHNPGNVEADSGESMDMAYLAHSIHRGHDRVPSFILAGGADDFSEVHYPQSVTYCETCHVASDDGYPEDGNAWDEGATAKSCGGCHADGLVAKDFDPITGQATYFFDHSVSTVDLGEQEDGSCAGCHLGAIPTAGPALAIHRSIRGDDRARAEAGDNFVFEIIGATNTGPGETPVVTFRVTNPAGDPYDILTDPEFDLATEDPGGNKPAALNLYVQWATADYYGGDENGQVLGARINNSLSVSAIQDLNFRDAGYPYRMYLGAIQDAIVNGDGTANADGSFTVPFFRALPDAFTGDVVIGLGGHPAWEFTDADGVTGYDRAAVVSALYFPGGPGRERQAAFSADNCNDCHKRIQAHGANRNGNAEFCLMCHNGDAAVCSVNPEADGSCAIGELDDRGNPIYEEGYHFGRMIHAIHAGSPTYEGGAFADVEFPQNIANCEACHIRDDQDEPLYNVARTTARAVSSSQGSDIRVWTDDIATTPTAAACGSCHTDAAAQSHFVTQGGQVDALKCEILGADCGALDGSSGSGLPNGQEACAVCHKAGATFETSKYHNPGL